jgi:hypothetical protein
MEFESGLYMSVDFMRGFDMLYQICYDCICYFQLNYFPNTEVQGPIVKFLKDYFTVYDSADRTGLSGAYHGNAMFSLSVAYNGAVQYKYVI